MALLQFLESRGGDGIPLLYDSEKICDQRTRSHVQFNFIGRLCRTNEQLEVMQNLLSESDMRVWIHLRGTASQVTYASLCNGKSHHP